MSAPAPEGHQGVDITSAGDAVVPTSSNSPGGEQAPNAIDNDPNTKYLNFDGANNTPSGLTISTGGGIVTGLGLTSANDAPDRDPATYIIWGSNDGENFTEIAQGDVPAFGARFERQTVSFDNDEVYVDYRIHFPTTAGGAITRPGSGRGVLARLANVVGVFPKPISSARHPPKPALSRKLIHAKASA